MPKALTHEEERQLLAEVKFLKDKIASLKSENSYLRHLLSLKGKGVKTL